MSINHVRPWRNIYRRKSRQIMVGSVPVGGDAPITVQTMTNTDTSDVKATVAQVLAAAEAGADIVRISTPDESSTKALKEIVRDARQLKVDDPLLVRFGKGSARVVVQNVEDEDDG